MRNAFIRALTEVALQDRRIVFLTADLGYKLFDDFARKWHILMKGSIVAAGEGDRLAARRAQEVGRLLLAAELDGRRGQPHERMAEPCSG